MSLRTRTTTAPPLSFAARPAAAPGECPIEVGVLHSLVGTMAVSEATLRDRTEMQADRRNAACGLPGCRIRAVVVDPASDWPLFAEKARELLAVD